MKNKKSIYTLNQLLENPFLNAQEKALRITYIPDELKNIIFKESITNKLK